MIQQVIRQNGGVLFGAVVKCLTRNSSLTAAKTCEKSSRRLGKEIYFSTGVRKPENTCASPTAMI